MKFTCAYCGAKANRSPGALNRSRAAGNNVYCSRKCSDLGRRKNKSLDQLKAEKAEYDREYRAKNRDTLKQKKAAYFQRTYDPKKAAEDRKKTMARHVAYCQRTEYRAWKKQYDRKYRAKKMYGDYAECFLLAMDIRAECLSKSSDYEIRLERGDYAKRKERKNDQQSNSNKPKAGSLGNLERGERGQNGRLASRQRGNAST